jgi:hypothetical protein
MLRLIFWVVPRLVVFNPLASEDGTDPVFRNVGY